MTATDENIMFQVMEGDIGQASILFERYHKSVYSYLARINGDKALAQDLTQNVFEKLIKYRTSYVSQKCFKAWLFTIARNINIDHHRRKKYSQMTEDFEIQDDSKGAQYKLETDERNHQLMLALNRLPEDEKELIVLTKFERMKYHQVANITGMTESALKVKAHRTMKKLKSILINDLNYEY